LPEPDRNPPGVLDGVVVDLSEGVAGGFCTKLLAALGATVIKVERPVSGDPVRSEPPFKDDVPDVETSTLHLHLSMAKQSVTLDWRTPAGAAVLRDLVAKASVLVESAAPGELDAAGIGHETLARERPELIVTSVTHFGSEGPYAGYRGNELVDYSVGGYSYLTGLPEREPIKAWGYQAQYQGGLHAATATMAALIFQDETGEGDHVDVSVAESICFTQAAMAAFLNGGVVFKRSGARLLPTDPSSLYPSTMLPCKDGYIHVHYAPTDPALLGVFTEIPRLSDPEVWETPRGHADEIDELLIPWLMKRDRREVVRIAQEFRNPFTEVLDPSDLLTDEQFVERGFFVEREHPVVGRFPHLGAPFRMSKTPLRVERAPLLGEHNDAVYRGLLGYTDAQIAALRESGVI
jgi:crotonobetainyl-CoA:carnitine CoA-transferase CaiB-like acyl-CoA transferase